MTTEFDPQKPMSQMSPDELRAIYMVPGNAERWNELRKAEPSFHPDLSERDLSGAQFEGYDLARTNLRNSRIHGANFTNTNLANARLGGVMSRPANNDGDRSNDRKTSFNRARFLETEFHSAALVDVQMREISGSIDFGEATLINVFIESAHLRETSFASAVLEHCGFRGCQMKGVCFSGAVLKNKTSFSSSELSEADFVNAQMHDAEFMNVNLEYATFSGAMSSKMWLSETNLRDADFSGARLKGALLHRSDFTGADLRSADLSDADFRGALIADARFMGMICNRRTLLESGQRDYIRNRLIYEMGLDEKEK